MASGIVWFVAALAPRALAAQIGTPAPAVEWEAPPGCPTREAFMGDLQRALGHSGGSRAGHVRVEIVQNADTSWTATVLASADGVSAGRVLRGETCQTVAAAAAVIAAVAIEPPSAQSVPVEAPPVASTTPAEPTRKPERSAAQRPPTRPSDGSARPAAGASQLFVGAAAVMDTAMMPALDLGVEGSVGWALRLGSFRLRLGAGGALFGDETIPVPGDAGDSGTFSLVTGGVRACGTKFFGPVEVGPCLGGEYDLMHGAGKAEKSLQGNGTWGALDGALLVAWSPGRLFGLNVRADGVLPLERPPFVIEGPSSSSSYTFVHRPAAATFRASAGIELRFF